MSESNNGGKPGGWFPDFNYLLLALLAGTLFVSQVPFHQWRPGTPESSSAVVYEVNARPWQDPFEAVNKYAVKENYQGTSEPGRIQDEIAHKIAAAIDDDGSQLDRVNVVAVMLPGGVYYEDGENRRKLRYAVLSGFNAALQYMPENSSSIQYFQNKALRIIYEWLVYQPTHHNLPPLLWQDTEPQAGEKRYERPPVLVLWLNSDDFSITPHQKLKDLISGNLGKDKIGKIAVLGPYDSGILQDLVGEMSIAERNKRDDERYSYYSPSATIQESNLLNENSQASLQQFFFDHGLKFQRITSTDQHLAVAVKDELELRGIEPSKRNRILLIGEWDSLYTWHLTNTFAGELLKNRENDCPSQDWYNR
ncbi:MAG TPA: hypothetical protein VLS45_06270, partial [Methylomicrobium sp.]|nr:hypothetical protein [Methylomicrobium sp.]